MEQTILDQIIDLIVSMQGLSRKKIHTDSKLENDLGITGDDAVDLLVAYSNKFHVDLSNFMAADYFDGEGLDSFGFIFRFFTGRKKKENKILTVAHLVKGVKEGKLDEEVINSA